MTLHNIMEDIVQAKIDEICESVGKNPALGEGICVCEQCRLDAACFVLNRVQPHYLVSNRGVARAKQESLERQQLAADVSTLVIKALQTVGHNRRDGASHNGRRPADKKTSKAVFNIPVIVGRLFNGQNFDPMSDINIELYHDGQLVEMKNNNWQNPCFLSSKTYGTYTFWPDSFPSKKTGEHKIFEFLIRTSAPGLEPLTHHFEVPVISEETHAESFSLERNFKIIDLYMFPPDKEG